jgi:endonuclease YncB( thermonuclease family)
MRKLAVCALILLAVVLLSGHGATFGSAANALRPGASRLATIAHVVDGDTLRVQLGSRGLVYVRLVGIDTPEDVKPVRQCSVAHGRRPPPCANSHRKGP